MKKRSNIKLAVESYRDPIVEEVRRIREARAVKFGFDIRKMVEDARKRQATSGHKVVDLSQDPPRVIHKGGAKRKRRKGLATSGW